MTQHTRPRPVLASPEPGPVTDLRRLFRANAAFSLTTGAIAAIASGPVADFLGLDQPWLVRVVGLGLVAFAGLLVVTSRQSPELLKAAAPAISAGDLGWVVATVVIIGWLSVEGALLMATIAVLVLALGIGQYRAGRRIGGS